MLSSFGVMEIEKELFLIVRQNMLPYLYVISEELPMTLLTSSHPSTS